LENGVASLVGFVARVRLARVRLCRELGSTRSEGGRYRELETGRLSCRSKNGARDGRAAVDPSARLERGRVAVRGEPHRNRDAASYLARRAAFFFFFFFFFVGISFVSGPFRFERVRYP
jgi:hypothetical protein